MDNKDEGTWIEVDGRVKYVESATSKQKNQKIKLISRISTALAGIGIVGGLILVSDNLDEIRNAVIEKNSSTLSKDNDDTFDEIHNPRNRGSSVSSNVDYSNMVYVYLKTEVGNPDFDKEIVFISGDDTYLVEYDKVHFYKLLGTFSKNDKLSVWEKEIREVEISSNGEMNELSDWMKTGEYIVDTNIQTDSLTERYVLIANYGEYSRSEYEQEKIK